ncbi:triose-phosphate transporter family-domain-containing protein [Phlyctochytrium arcticum]|nr:triose-phosphate transporter family-domain-containing protein [Phlyctochytrium arcticum]
MPARSHPRSSISYDESLEILDNDYRDSADLLPSSRDLKGPAIVPVVPSRFSESSSDEGNDGVEASMTDDYVPEKESFWHRRPGDGLIGRVVAGIMDDEWRRGGPRGVWARQSRERQGKLRKAFLGGCYILAWYATSLPLSIFNKWLLSEEHYDFKFPLFATTIHMVIQFTFSLICVTFFWPRMRPTTYPSWKDYGSKVMPCGVATGLDIGLSNQSLQIITLSFYTMVKSSAPVFVLLFAFLFRLERPTWSLSGIILVISFGMFLMVSSETQFNPVGYMLVQVATILSGFRWALTQILLQRESMGMNNPLATTLFLTPLMGVTLLIASGTSEGFSNVFASPFFATFSSSIGILALISLGGALAFLMVVAEFMLVRHTSVVTFSIAGIVKEIITILAATIIFGDSFPPNKVLGLVISIMGIAAYNFLRIRNMSSSSSHNRHRKGASPVGFSPLENEGAENDAEYLELEDSMHGLVATGRGLFGFHAVSAIAGTGRQSFDARGGMDEQSVEDVEYLGYDDVELSH